MANPSADFPTGIHSATDISAYGNSALGKTAKKHTEVEGKQEQEIVAIQTELGVDTKTITEATAPAASPASVAEYLDMVATQLKAIIGGAHWYTPISSTLATLVSHLADLANPHSVTKTQVGLGNVTNDAQLKAADLDTDTTLAANSDSKIPSQKAVKTYTDGLVVGLLDDRGNYDASTNVFPSTGGSGTAGAIKKGDLWFISVAGTLGGVVVNIGDQVRALADDPGQTASNWSISEANLGYTPENQANKSTDDTLVDDSDTKYPSQSAVKGYVDDKNKKYVSIIDDFQTEDWEHEAGGTGTMSYDTSDFVAGSKSLKLITVGGGTAVNDYLRKDIALTLNSNKQNYLEIDVKIENAPNVSRFYLYLYSSVASNKYRYAQIEATGRKNIPDGEWTTLKVALQSFLPSSGETISTIGYVFERLRFRISDDGTPITVRLGGIRLVERNKRAVVAITFDDSNASVFTKAMPYMERYGIKGTCFNIPYNVGLSGQYMTITNLQVLEKLGWTNALHGESPNDDGWGNLTEEQLVKYISDEINYWKANNLTSGLDCVAYPNGNFGESYSNYIYRVTKRFCKIGRGTNTGHTEPCGDVTDPLILKVGQQFYLRASVTSTEINESLDRLAAEGGLAIIPVHDIVDSEASGSDCLTSEFYAVIDKIAELQEAGSIEVMTFAQLRDELIASNVIDDAIPFNSYVGFPDATGTAADVQQASRSWFREVLVRVPILISKIAVGITAQAGNVCMGIYNETGTLLATTGSVACPAVGVAEVNLTSSVILQPGRYYLAISADTITTAQFRETATFLMAGSFYKSSHFPLANLTGRVDAETSSSSRAFALVAKP